MFTFITFYLEQFSIYAKSMQESGIYFSFHVPIAVTELGKNQMIFFPQPFSQMHSETKSIHEAEMKISKYETYINRRE